MRRETKCRNQCDCCHACLKNNIMTQFDRNSDMKLIKCICKDGELPEDVIEATITEKEYARLKRIRLSRKIDQNDEMIWCPNLNCEKDITRLKKGDKKVECKHCGHFACFKC